MGVGVHLPSERGITDHRNHTVITYRSKAWRGAASAVARRFFHGTWIRTFTIITTDANELVAEIHDRMPLILAPSVVSLTLGPRAAPGSRRLQSPSTALCVRFTTLATTLAD